MAHGLEIIIALNNLEDPDSYVLQTSGQMIVYKPKKEQNKEKEDD